MKKIISVLTVICMLLSMMCGTLSCATNPASEPKDSDSDTEAATESDSADGSTQTETSSQPEETTEADTDGGENEPTEKVIDLYLIAGQSNAVGYTKITKLSNIYAWCADLKTGFTNVHYAGNSRSNGSEPRDRDLPWQRVIIGLGAIGYSNFGPEAGMAKAFSEYYNEETGRDAGMIKYAFGGSSLLNLTTGSTHQDGNWVSPSYQKTLPASEITNATGQMYRNFLEQVERNISELMEYGGYTSVNICGLYWMQGCANKSNPIEYEKAFRYFATDIRADLSKILKEYTGTDDDCGASEMPIIVGTISQTQNLTSATTEQTNKTFIQMQKSLATKIENCYVVDNSAYPITKWENGTQVIVGSDQWHWNQADMLEIGNNVGKAMLYCAGITETDPFPAS